MLFCGHKIKIVVPKRIYKKAVDRNKARRRIRAVLIENDFFGQKKDILVNLKSSIDKLSYMELTKWVKSLFS